MGSKFLATIFIISFAGIILIALVIDSIVRGVKKKGITKNGKRIKVKVAGATYCGSKEISTMHRCEYTNYFYPIFSEEDIFGGITYHVSVKKVTDVELQQLVNKGEVDVISYKNLCVIDEDFSLMGSAFPVPYMGKHMGLDEEGAWKPAKVQIITGKNKEKSRHKENPRMKTFKVIAVILSIISACVFLGCIAFIVYGILSRQYSLIIGAVITLIATVLFDFRILLSMINGLLAHKKGKRAEANAFSTDVLYYESSSMATPNYIVKYSFYDQFGNLRNTEEIVSADVYHEIKDLQKLPIKVYKKNAVIYLDND